MKLAGLVSGGKDSIAALHFAVAMSHEIVVCIHMSPLGGADETDSYMYQSVGSNVVRTIVEDCLRLPYMEIELKRGSVEISKLEYERNELDEVEDLYEALYMAKKMYNIEGVTTGALRSDYQRLRVENVCARLGLISFAYLWKLSEPYYFDLLNMKLNVEAIVIKVATMGLDENDLGKSLKELEHKLKSLSDYVSICGEGGEYETLVVDCPLYINKLNIYNSNTIISSSDPYSPTCYLKINSFNTSTSSVPPLVSIPPPPSPVSLAPFLNILTSECPSHLFNVNKIMMDIMEDQPLHPSVIIDPSLYEMLRTDTMSSSFILTVKSAGLINTFFDGLSESFSSSLHKSPLLFAPLSSIRIDCQCAPPIQLIPIKYPDQPESLLKYSSSSISTKLPPPLHRFQFVVFSSFYIVNNRLSFSEMFGFIPHFHQPTTPLSLKLQETHNPPSFEDFCACLVQEIYLLFTSFTNLLEVVSEKCQSFICPPLQLNVSNRVVPLVDGQQQIVSTLFAQLWLTVVHPKYEKNQVSLPNITYCDQLAQSALFSLCSEVF